MSDPSGTTVRYARDGRIARITLARPEVRNAFNDQMLADLAAAFGRAAADPDLRVVVLAGEGKAFCAGADLAWMGQVIERDFDHNLAESLALARLFETIASLPLPVVARVQGAAIGGGNGLVAASDIAVATETAVFSLSEVKLGLIPSAIGPHVVRRIGEGRARALFLTGERIDGRRAAELGLVHRAVPESELDAAVGAVVDQLLASGPRAMAAAKRLLVDIRGQDGDELVRITARAIAELRVSPEGQEGMRAFLEKRRPAWAEAKEQQA